MLCGADLPSSGWNASFVRQKNSRRSIRYTGYTCRIGIEFLLVLNLFDSLVHGRVFKNQPFDIHFYRQNNKVFILYASSNFIEASEKTN